MTQVGCPYFVPQGALRLEQKCAMIKDVIAGLPDSVLATGRGQSDHSVEILIVTR